MLRFRLLCLRLQDIQHHLLLHYLLPCPRHHNQFQNAFYENPGFNNNWIVLQLKGKTCNSMAVGAMAQLTITENGAQRNIYRALIAPPKGVDGFAIQAIAFDVMGQSAVSQVVLQVVYRVVF